MSTFYHSSLSEDLRQRVQEQLKKLPAEQFSLQEEVAIQKTLLADVVKEWSEARDMLRKLSERDPQHPEMKAVINAARARLYASEERLKEAMNNHKDLVSSAAASESKTRELLTEKTLTILISAVIDLVHNYFNEGTEESIELLKNFEYDLRNRVTVKESDEKSLAIETEFYDMLETIPRISE